MLNTMTTRNDPQEKDPARALAALRAAQRRWERAKAAFEAEDAARDLAVGICRQTNPQVIWSDIAAVTGTHQPHAVRKWKKLLVETRTVTVTPRRSKVS